jgi:hypothetical protein
MIHYRSFSLRGSPWSRWPITTKTQLLRWSSSLPSQSHSDDHQLFKQWGDPPIPWSPNQLPDFTILKTRPQGQSATIRTHPLPSDLPSTSLRGVPRETLPRLTTLPLGSRPRGGGGPGGGTGWGLSGINKIWGRDQTRDHRKNQKRRRI